MSLLTNFARGVKVELIAKLATSYEAYDGGTLIKGVARHNIRDYFRKYGSTARKFDHIAEDDIYIGYVRMPYKPEFLSAIILAGDNAVAVSFDSEVGESNDFLTLMAKKEFADRMTAAVQRAASFMRNATTPPAPQPETEAIAASPTNAARKGDNALGWTAVIAVSAILGAIFFIPLLVENEPPDTSGRANFAQRNSYEEPADAAPPYTPPPTDLLDGTNVESGIAEGMTFGIANAIMLGIDEFSATYTESGMIGAEAQSKECFERAKSSTDILEIDRCAAFDFTAQFRDDVASGQYGFPANSYFQDSSARLEEAYARFPEHNMTRLAMVRDQTVLILRDMANRMPG